MTVRAVPSLPRLTPAACELLRDAAAALLLRTGADVHPRTAMHEAIAAGEAAAKAGRYPGLTYLDMGTIDRALAAAIVADDPCATVADIVETMVLVAERGGL